MTTNSCIKLHQILFPLMINISIFSAKFATKNRSGTIFLPFPSLCLRVRLRLLHDGLIRGGARSIHFRILVYFLWGHENFHLAVVVVGQFRCFFVELIEHLLELLASILYLICQWEQIHKKFLGAERVPYLSMGADTPRNFWVPNGYHVAVVPVGDPNRQKYIWTDEIIDEVPRVWCLPSTQKLLADTLIRIAKLKNILIN